MVLCLIPVYGVYVPAYCVLPADAAMQSAGCYLYDNCENIFVRRVMLFVNKICNPYAVRTMTGQTTFVA